MNIEYQVPQMKRDTAVALGFFDGLHRGHRKVISGAVHAKERGLLPVVFTFLESPLGTLSQKSIPRLMTEEEKHRRLQALGVEEVVSLPFLSMKDLSAPSFVTSVLHEKLCAKEVYCGFNYHFGAGGSAGFEELQALCAPYSIKVFPCPPVLQGREPVSSTRIRGLLMGGKIEEANRLLGYRFGFAFPVVGGRRLGRLMGTPTLNQPFPEGFILPRFGVYASIVRFQDVVTYGVTNIGVKPTVGADGPLAETWMPEYNGRDLYGEKVRTELVAFLRPEKKFSGIEQLRAAILKNGEEARALWQQKMADDAALDL